VSWSVIVAADGSPGGQRGPRREGPARPRATTRLSACPDPRAQRTCIGCASRPNHACPRTGGGPSSRCRRSHPPTTSTARRCGSSRPIPRAMDCRVSSPSALATIAWHGSPRTVDGSPSSPTVVCRQRRNRRARRTSRIGRTRIRSTSCRSTLQARRGASPTCRVARRRSNGRPMTSAWSSSRPHMGRRSRRTPGDVARPASRARMRSPTPTTGSSTGSGTCSTGLDSNTTGSATCGWSTSRAARRHG
jgi:hypothetical protein